jgi:hypothetical protein
LDLLSAPTVRDIDVNGIIAAGVSWSDPEYTQAHALFNIVNNFRWGSAWTYFNPSQGFSLFSDKTSASVSSGDMIQGAIGNCWLIAGIASVGKDKEEIYKMFDQKEMNPAGIYSVRLYSFLGIPVTVYVDDKFPLDSTWRPVYARFTPEKEIWPMLLEKAVSKLIGNFDMTVSGTPNDGMFLLTGGPSFWYLNTSKTADLIHADIVNFMA